MRRRVARGNAQPRTRGVRIFGLPLGCGLIRSYPQSGRSEGYGGEEVSGELVVACRNPPEVLEPAEEALDEISLAVESRIDRSLNLAVALGWNVSLSTALLDQINQMPPVIAAIGDDDRGWP